MRSFLRSYGVKGDMTLPEFNDKAVCALNGQDEEQRPPASRHQCDAGVMLAFNCQTPYVRLACSNHKGGRGDP